MTTREAVPTAAAGPSQASLTDALPGKPGTVTSGPVLTELRVANAFDSGRFATTIRVYADLRRIDVETRLVNNEKYVRYRGLFPTTIQNGKTVHEIPFGSIERPDAIEFPAQNWADHSDGKHGLALLNVGLPGNTTSGGTMMVSLLRSHNLGAYGFGGGYEPGMSSETGFQIGQERVLHYALLPHAGDWRDAAVHRDALEFNHPLICRKALPHNGSLPKRWGFLTVSAANIIVSSVKLTSSVLCAVRVYEASGKAAPNVSLAPQLELLAAHEANLLEDSGRELKVENNGVRFDLHPFEIKTILFKFGALVRQLRRDQRREVRWATVFLLTRRTVDDRRLSSWNRATSGAQRLSFRRAARTLRSRGWLIRKFVTRDSAHLSIFPDNERQARLPRSLHELGGNLTKGRIGLGAQ